MIAKKYRIMARAGLHGDGAQPLACRLAGSAKLGRHVAECVVGEDKRAADQFGVVVDQVGETHAGKQGDGEDFLNGFFEFQKRHDLAALDVDDPHAAGAFGFLKPLGDLDAAEDGRFANLRQADEGQVADHFEAAGETVEVDDRFVLAGVQINGAKTAGARFEQPQAAGMPARRMGHRQIAGDDFVRVDVDQDAAALFVFAPAAGRVGFAERRDPLWLAVDDAEAVEMAAVVRRELRDELRPPDGAKL